MIARRRIDQVRTPDPGIEQRYAILQSSALFSVLSEQDLTYAAERSLIRRFRRMETVIRQNSVSTGMHAILEGSAKLSVEPDGGEVIYAMLGAGDWFGEIALIDGGPEPVSATATRPLLLMTVDRATVLDLLDRNKRLAISFAQLLAKRVRSQERRIEEIHLYDLSTRLARTLVLLAERSDGRDGEALRVTFPITQSELAAMLGATRVRVNLLLGAYREAGIIRVDRASIMILSPERLYERAAIPYLS